MTEERRLIRELAQALRESAAMGEQLLADGPWAVCWCADASCMTTCGQHEKCAKYNELLIEAAKMVGPT